MKVELIMYYLDFRMTAKRYNKLFYYGFGRDSLRNPYFWASCAFLIGMLLACYIQIAHPDITGPFYWKTLLCILVFEFIFFGLYQAHIDRNQNRKFAVLGHNDPVDRDAVKIGWLDVELGVRRERYQDLVASIEALEQRMDADRYNTKSLFERYNSIVFWPKRFISTAAIAVLAPVSLFAIQAYLEKKEWTAYFQPFLISNNISAILTIIFGIAVLGSLAALALSLIKVLICYCVDVNKENLCSQPSVDRLLYDLLRFSRIEIVASPNSRPNADAS